MIDLDRDGDVFVLRMNAGENRFSPGFLRDVGQALDEVEKAGSPAALVTTGTGKFYSNGLDLDHMTGEGSARAGDYLADVLGLLGRILTFSTFTVAAEETTRMDARMPARSRLAGMVVDAAEPGMVRIQDSRERCCPSTALSAA